MVYIWIAVGRFSDFFFMRDERDTAFLPFFRISIALFSFLHFCAVWQDFLTLYGNQGIVPADLVGLFKAVWIPSFSQVSHWLEETNSVSEASTAALFKILFLAACLALLRGWATPLSAFVLLFLHLMMTKGAPLYAYGVDYFKTIALFYCLVFSVGQRLIQYPTPFRRILQLHLCIVYFFSGFEKLLGYNWHNGEAVWKALHLPYMSSGIVRYADALGGYPLVFILAGWGVVLTELAYPVFMHLSKTKKYWLMLVIILHVGIAVSLRLYFFSTLMIILNLAAFMDFNRYYREVRVIRQAIPGLSRCGHN